MKRYIIAILVALCVAACTQHSEHWETMSQVESYINERPDSALIVMQNIDVDELSSKQERAKHALLLSMALDKNYIDETDDSLITSALEYYNDSDDVKYKFLAYYYYGRILGNGGDYSQMVVLNCQIICRYLYYKTIGYR